MIREKSNSSLEVNQVRIEFSTKKITAYGGIATLISKFIEQIDFRSWVEHNIPVTETSNNRGGVYEKIIGHFLIVLSGGFRFNHLWYGRGVEAILATFGLKWLPSSASTLTRFFGKLNNQALAQTLGDAARRFACRLLEWSGEGSGNLRFDSSVITRYGDQDGAKKGYNPAKPGRKSHHPIFAFAGNSMIVNLWNRSGNSFSGDRIVEFFNQTVECLSAISYKINRVLCDSGFYLADFVEHLENHGLKYIIAARFYGPLQKRTMTIERWSRIAEGIEVGEFFFEHASEKWTKPRRYVVVRQSIAARPNAAGKQPSLFAEFDEWENYRVSLFLTNEEELSPEQVWRNYRPRAADENAIKELKEGYGLASFNMKNFWATESVMVLNTMLFHNMIQYMNIKIFNPKSGMQTLQTLRSRYFVIGAQLGGSGGKKILRLATGTDKKLRAKIVWMMEQISRIPHKLQLH